MPIMNKRHTQRTKVSFSENIVSRKGILHLILITVLIPLYHEVLSQADYTKLDPTPEGKIYHCDIDVLPGGEHCLIASALNESVIKADAATMQPVQTYKAAKWKAGSKIEISPNGKYALLKQQFYIDYSPNKDREVEFEVLDLETGKVALKISAAHDADFHPDGERLIVLEGDDVFSYQIEGNQKKTLFPVPEATNCIAVSKDGKQIALSHHPSDDYLNDYVTKKRQKKNFKLYKKYRQCVSVFDTETFEKLYTVDEMYDIPYILEYDPSDEHFICYSVPHTKIVEKTGMQGTRYISKIDAADGSNTSVGFVSSSYYEPDIEFSKSGNYISLVTTTHTGFPEVWVADYHTGDVVARYTLENRVFGGGHMKGEIRPDAGRVGVDFSADETLLYITYGSLIIEWKIPYKL
jgi:DNA-binding beta-propeller fold protein YncE